MPQVTVPPASANNLPTSLSEHSLVYNPALAHCSMGISSVWDHLTNYGGNWNARAFS